MNISSDLRLSWSVTSSFMLLELSSARLSMLFPFAWWLSLSGEKLSTILCSDRLYKSTKTKAFWDSLLDSFRDCCLTWRALSLPALPLTWLAVISFGRKKVALTLEVWARWGKLHEGSELKLIGFHFSSSVQAFSIRWMSFQLAWSWTDQGEISFPYLLSNSMLNRSIIFKITSWITAFDASLQWMEKLLRFIALLRQSQTWQQPVL